MLKNLHRRKQKGQSMIVLIVFLMVFFILLLGMTAFEFARYSLCCQQFQHCVDIAALGGAAGLASSQNTNQAAAQGIAIQTAQWMMEQNYILDRSLSGMTNWTAGTAIPTMPATANRANMTFTWVDPETGVPTGVPADQKVFRVSGCYAYPPLVGSWIGLGNNTLGAVVAIGNGGGTMLDVVLCFDLSGSIDDSTIVSYVERWCNSPPGPTNRNQYRQVTTFGTGQMYTGAGCSSLTGTSINACYPQSIESTDPTRVSGQGQLRYNNLKRGITQGNPPGQFGASADLRTLTDIVVNLDENPVFGGITVSDPNTGVLFPFPTLGSLVEAARGNLESVAIANAANVNTTALGVTPTPGYYQAYWKNALMHRHPLYDAQQSSATFFQILNNSVNAHFGFVGFGNDENQTPGPSDEAIGNPASHSFPMGAPAGLIPTSNSVNTPYPFVALNPGAGSAFSNFTAVMNLLPPINPPASPQLSANGGTDINGALNEALQMLARNTPAPSDGYPGTSENLSRVGSRRAVVLFTDGLPNGNTGPRGSADGIQCATDAANMGIPIYCIGLAQNAPLIPPMTAALSPIASISGGQFYQIPPGAGQSAALNRAFADIARSLIALTR